MGKPTKNHPDDTKFGQRCRSFCSDRGTLRFGVFRAGTRGRWHTFMHGRSWLWLAPAAVAAFVVLFLVRRFGDNLTTGAALGKAVVYTAAFAVCWAIGIWAASGGSSESVAGAEQEPQEHPSLGFLPGWARSIVLVLIVLLVLGAICSSQIAGMVEGEVSLGRGIGGIFLKIMAVAAVLLPSWLENRNR